MIPLPLLPAPVQQAAQLFAEAGEAAWLVGGATRDLLLGRPIKDFDFVIADDGLRWARRLADRLGGAFVALDEERRVGRVVVTHAGGPLWLDVARFRDVEGAGGTLEGDLRLRDFTVNAIALDLRSGETVDPTGGVADLRAGRLRATGPRSLLDDPLRLLRAVRFHATHALHLEPTTRAAMEAAVPMLPQVALERVRDEWVRLLAPPEAPARVALLDELGALAWLFPALVACKGITQSPPHSHDVFGHSLLVLGALEGLIAPSGAGAALPISASAQLAAHLAEPLAHELPRWLLLKQVALLHDIGKAQTRTVGPDGRIHFYGHEEAGAQLIGPALRRLKFPASAVAYSECVVRWHLRPLQLSQRLPPSARATYRFFRDAGRNGPDVALHSIADQRGKNVATDRAEVIASVNHLLHAFFEQPSRFVTVRPLLDGNELMALTGQRGPAIGQMLEFLREQQAQQRITTRAEAERALRGWQGRRGAVEGKRHKSKRGAS